MFIFINDKKTEVISGETLFEAAQREGFEIPSMCYAKGYKHKASCMVCAVKNLQDGQIIPSCTTYPEEGMMIDVDSEEVQNIRVLSLELLLSDHRADCEAPCSLVCPHGLEVEQMLSYYDASRFKEAYLLISKAFPSPQTACETCKAPCEKACRRGTVDDAVPIREIIKQITAIAEERFSNTIDCFVVPHRNDSDLHRHCELAKQSNENDNMKCSLPALIFNRETNKNAFQSRLGRFTPSEKQRLKSDVTPPSRCLHCACAGRNGCKLRLHATSAGIKRPRYEAISAHPAMFKQQINEKIWFEPAKCIRCGLCVYNSANGFTFKDRGFGMQVILPDENRENIKEELASLCPTGALYIYPYK